MKKTIIIIIILLLAGVGGYYYFNNKKANNGTQASQQKQSVPQADGAIKKNPTKTNEQENSSKNEFLVYQDKDIIFKYPKKLISTKSQDNFETKKEDKWKVVRKGNTIYILAPFENNKKIGEYSSFMIKIFDNTWATQKEFDKIIPLYKEDHNVPVPQWGNKLYTMTSAGYYVGTLTKVAIDMGIVDDVYFLVPDGIDDRAQSKKPNKKHFVVYAWSDIYTDYIKNILLPSIKGQ